MKLENRLKEKTSIHKIYIRKHQAVERFSGKSWKGFWEDSQNKAVVAGSEVGGVQSRNDTAHPAGLDQLRYHICPMPQTEHLWKNWYIYNI